MTVQEIKMLFAYNAWATNRVFESLTQVPEELSTKDLKGSHGGIRGTLTHLVGAEMIWLSRWEGKSKTPPLTEKEAPSLAALKGIWEGVASRTARYIAKLDEKRLRSSLEYTTIDGRTYIQAYQETLQHLVNHSTYHRGQITTLMRQVGAQPAGTDLVAFYRHAAQPTPKR
jgi:uncharacterized damage-inducible protein DinB